MDGRYEKTGPPPTSESTIFTLQSEGAAEYGSSNKTETGGGRVSREKDWLLSAARERSSDVISSKMANLASVAENLAAAFQDSARDLSAKNSTIISHYCDLTAGELTTVAAALRHWDLDVMIKSTRKFAGSHPIFFLGGAVAAGFLFTRVLKSSSPEQQEMISG
jgi:hypothetical protein